jgi:Co/Zn/Cd efflux system component
MSCDCHLEARDEIQRKVLRTLLAINGAMFVVEVVVGLLADSSGLIADSLDMLADALVYGIALYAIGRDSCIKVRAARWSGWLQIALATSILLDAIRRAVFGSEPSSLLMLLMSGCALGANAWCLKLLARHRNGEVHMRASWIFTRSDVIANAGVMLAALLVALTETRWPDLVIGAAIAGVVIKGGFTILSEVAQAGLGRSSSGAAGAE